ncbi:hypothetical protein MPL1032_180046 [Mesorhizobium plurifarium]|uniref:Transposase n=1 Tax=Mesorhizobium plurifarium TaxID=69974 RepID=A0A0K2VU69_MESPL|nr:hypothetical protein MPL1032_180046 [Mesorhizobium plurifarium]
MAVAPALIPKRPGERVKTNRRDAVTLARLKRAGELIGVWVPDVVHEAVRDLVRGREAAADDLRRKRQQLLSFLLRHGRIYESGGHWTLAHRRWLARQSFEHTAQQIVFQEKMGRGHGGELPSSELRAQRDARLVEKSSRTQGKKLESVEVPRDYAQCNINTRKFKSVIIIIT